MIKCNLATLIAERGLNISKVSRETGISRTTLTSLANNTGSGVQLETIDKLCLFLNIGIEDFFIYHPSTVRIERIYTKDTDDEKIYLHLEIRYKKQVFSVLLSADIKVIQTLKSQKIDIYVCVDSEASTSIDDSLALQIDYGNEFFEEYFKRLPIIFKIDLENKIKAFIIKEAHIDENDEIIFLLEPQKQGF